MRKLLAALLVVAASSAHAQTYYVGPSGLDTNTGLSLNTRLKTIAAGIAKAQTAGDIVYVTSGTYPEQINIPQNSITVSNYPGATAIIDGATIPDSDWVCMICIDGNYNRVNGFEVKNVNMGGTKLGGEGVQVIGHHNTVSRLVIHNVWEHGIILEGDYSTAQENTVYSVAMRNINGNMLSQGGGWPSALSAGRNHSPDALIPGITSYATIKRNKSYNNWGEGISCYETYKCTISYNESYDNWTQNMYLSDSRYGSVIGNLVYLSSNPAIAVGSANTGITLADELSNGTTIPRSSNNVVANNFLYNADLSAMAWTNVPAGLDNATISNNTIVDGTLSTGVSPYNVASKILNNVIIDPAAYSSDIPSNTGIAFTKNSWWTTTPPLAASGTNISGDPQIIRSGPTTAGNMTGLYFGQGATSPTRNVATVLSTVPSDFWGRARGTLPDAGGNEAGAAWPVMTISSIVAKSNSTTQAIITWATSDKSTGVVNYGVSPTSLCCTLNASTAGWSQGVTFGGLSAGQTIYYKITATHYMTGVQTVSPVYSFVVQSTNP